MTHVDCDQLRLLLADELPASQKSELTEHLAICTSCRQSLESLAGDGAWWSEVQSSLRAGGSKPGPATGATQVHAEPQCESNGADFAVDFLEPCDQADALGRIGEYEIVEMIGRGGMGVILKGYHRPLGRFVAVKVMAPHLAASGAARQRFVREARAAAAIVHPNVMPIHSVSTASRLPFLVMPFVACESLQQRIDREGALELKEILRIGIQVASGLAAAHAQGLVHRDVKPANILLEKGVDRVLLTDFGLARASEDASLTGTGFVAGTPQYMSPEQWEEKPVDARSDLFSLGSVIYTMCTGRPPFQAPTTLGILRQISDAHPRSIREIQSDLPDWLDRIVRRLQAKMPEHRFQTAKDVAEILEQCLAHLLQTSIPLPRALIDTRARFRHGQRQPLFLLAVTAGVLTLGIAIWQFAARSGNRGFESADEASVSSSVSPAGAAVRQPRQTLLNGVEETDDLSLSAASEGSADARAATKTPSFDGERAAADDPTVVQHSPQNTAQRPTTSLENETAGRPMPLVLIGHADSVTGVAFSPDGKRLASSSTDETVRLWDTATGQELLTLDGHDGRVLCVAFSPDGERLASGSDKEINLWSASTGKVQRTLLTHTALVSTVAFSPDGKRLASGSYDKTVKVWDTAPEAITGAEILSFDKHQDVVWCVAFSPDGKRLATASRDNTIKFWDTMTGAELHLIRAQTGATVGIAFSPDRKWLAASSGNDVILWDATNGEIVRRLKGHTGQVLSVAFSPDGRRLASAGWDKLVKVWDVSTGQELLTLEGHANRISSVTFSPDGRRLASAGADRTVRIWNVTPRGAPGTE